MEETKEAIGVDIGGTNIRVARISADGRIIDRITAPVPSGKEAQLNTIIECVEHFMKPGIEGVGIGIAGRVRMTDGRVLTAGFLELRDVPLGEIMKERTGIPVFVDNDAHMAAFGEVKVGAGVGKRNVVMFTIGTGIGGAVILDNQIIYGSSIAGQLGHLTVDMNGKVCNCGRRGCVETTSSGTALRGLIEEAGLPSKTMIDDLFSMDASGNRLASDILTRWAAPLQFAIDSAVAALAPEIVLLGGGLGTAAFRALSRLPGGQSQWFQCPIKPGLLGDNAGIIGAGLRVI